MAEQLNVPKEIRIIRCRREVNWFSVFLSYMKNTFGRPSSEGPKFMDHMAGAKWKTELFLMVGDSA